MVPRKLYSSFWPSPIFASQDPSLGHTTSHSLGVAVDILLVAVLSIVGAFQFFSCDHYPNFLHEDVSYYELAHSLATQRTYGFNGRLETVQAPGTSALIAVLLRSGIVARPQLLQCMTLLFFLGLLASYAFLRGRFGRVFAAASCILVVSAPPVFAFTTRLIGPAIPYLLVSMLALLAAARLDRAESRRSNLFWQFTLSCLLAAALLVHGSAVALLSALVLWSLAGILNFAEFRRRLRKFVPVILVGCIVFIAWAQRAKSTVKEWPLAGYPGSYTSQFVLKSGNQPELGHASLSDYVVRFGTNLESFMDQFVALFTAHWVDLTWSAFIPCAIILLVMFSLANFIIERQFSPAEWYFVIYLGLFLLWPWTLEIRFLLPILPLFCVYVFDGGRVLPRLVQRNPRLAGTIGCLLFFTLATNDVYVSLLHKSGAMQLKISAGIWILSAMASVLLLLRKSPSLRSLINMFQDRISPERLTGMPANFALGALAFLIFCAHSVFACSADLRTARQNLAAVPQRTEVSSDIDAARWVAANTASSATIMARHVPITFYYAHRNTVWFPPISSAEVLMDGIQRLGVDYVIVIHRDDDYYLPTEQICFQSLQRAYPTSFTRVISTPEYAVFRVSPGLRK